MLETKAKFLESRVNLDNKIAQAQKVFNSLSKANQSKMQVRANRLNKIDDRSAELKKNFDFVSKMAEDNKSSSDRAFINQYCTNQAQGMFQELENLHIEVDEIIRELKALEDSIDKTKSFEVIKTNPVSAQPKTMTDIKSVTVSKGWRFLAVVVGLISWFIWRNHDFTQAVMISGKPVAFQLRDASSWWAAVMAGLAGYTATIVFGLLFRSSKRGDR